MAHTPGPWKVEEGTTLVWGACDSDDTSTFGMGYPIVAGCRSHSVWAKGLPSDEEQQANARLIAAAPEMLAVLQVIEAGSFPGAAEFVLNGDWHGFATALQKYAGAAIAKAIAL